MTGLAHISRFSHETARRIIERSDLHGNVHLRAACTWPTIHGDWLDVNRAAALMRALDRGEKPQPLPPRGADMEGPVSTGYPTSNKLYRSRPKFSSCLGFRRSSRRAILKYTPHQHIDAGLQQ